MRRRNDSTSSAAGIGEPSTADVVKTPPVCPAAFVDATAGSIEMEIAALNEEMQRIHLQYREIVNAHRIDQNNVPPFPAEVAVAGSTTAATKQPPDVFRSPRMVPRMGTRLDRLPQAGGGGGGDVTPRMSPKRTPVKDRRVMLVDDASNAAVLANGVDVVLRREISVDAPVRDCFAGAAGAAGAVAASHRSAGPSRLPSSHHHSDLDQRRGPAPSSSTDAAGAVAGQREWNSDGDGSGMSSAAVAAAAAAAVGVDDKIDSLQALYTQYADVMYTNKANLQHTMMVQQNLFQQQLQAQQRIAAAAGNPSESAASPPSQPTSSPSRSPAKQHRATNASIAVAHCHATTTTATAAATTQSSAQTIDDETLRCAAAADPRAVVTDVVVGKTAVVGVDVQMEWVVKRRADGSRYITRRPVRNRFLKERARKLAEERCGVTTDDDAVSELKVGRYWSREERKRHLEKARDHRRQKAALLRHCAETAAVRGGGGDDQPPREPNAVELGHRKNVRHRGRKVLDDFTTVQELLAHGSRESAAGKTYNPLLSVTTV